MVGEAFVGGEDGYAGVGGGDGVVGVVGGGSVFVEVEVLVCPFYDGVDGCSF